MCSTRPHARATWKCGSLLKMSLYHYFKKADAALPTAESIWIGVTTAAAANKSVAEPLERQPSTSHKRKATTHSKETQAKIRYLILIYQYIHWYMYSSKPGYTYCFSYWSPLIRMNFIKRILAKVVFELDSHESWARTEPLNIFLDDIWSSTVVVL